MILPPQRWPIAPQRFLRVRVCTRRARPLTPLRVALSARAAHSLALHRDSGASPETRPSPVQLGSTIAAVYVQQAYGAVGLQPPPPPNSHQKPKRIHTPRSYSAPPTPAVRDKLQGLWDPQRVLSLSALPAERGFLSDHHRPTTNQKWEIKVSATRRRATGDRDRGGGKFPVSADGKPSPGCSPAPA